uniref:PH domain-containing protein n=1 Tax=Haptolina brevifila TaxID=156173 RepID=A0A7S2G7W3_9EUKA|mmetsp:Transcript_28940/g.58254  ORF Transcript_28940/g.58254 Transcript_28940/m.58254 type:complete len:721 (+) Transcript_28940:66-2228(+)
MAMTDIDSRASMGSMTEDDSSGAQRLEGALEKKSDFLGRYNLRHVRLSENGMLHWYVDEQAESAKGMLSLAHAEISVPAQDIVADGETSPGAAAVFFHVKTPSRSAITFRCADPDTREMWATALSEVAAKATVEKVKAEEEKKARAAEEKRLKNFGVGLPPTPPKTADDDDMPAQGPVEERSVKGTTALTAEEVAKLNYSEAIALETAMEDHKQRAKSTKERAERAAAELAKVLEQQSGGKRTKELRLAELDSAAADLSTHKELLMGVIAAESRSRAAINSAEGAARSAAERLGSQEQKRREELKALEEEHAALLASQKAARDSLTAKLNAAKDAGSKADSSANVALTMVELRKEQLAGLETLLTAKEHDRDVLMATLKGQTGSLLASSNTKEGVEVELASMVAAAAELSAEATEMQHAERAAKLLAASMQQRLEAAKGAAAEFAGVMAAQRTPSSDPTYAPSAYKDSAGDMLQVVSTQLQDAKAAEATREKEAATKLSLLKAKSAAAETAISIKKGFVKDLVEAHELLAGEVAASEVASSAAVQLCAALTEQRKFIQEELVKLNETLIRERSASAEAKKAIEGLLAEEKALVIANEHAIAAIDALLIEERTRAAALAEKRTPASLPAETQVFISMPKGEGEHVDKALPLFLSEAVEEVDARLTTLATMREVVLRDHEADAKQLAAEATQATAKEAFAAAETAAQARARAALEKFEAALN